MGEDAQIVVSNQRWRFDNIGRADLQCSPTGFLALGRCSQDQEGEEERDCKILQTTSHNTSISFFATDFCVLYKKLAV
ncbi:MAG: hypothetical protein A4E46_00722 [Methanosaeta sp. PtaU1.Bin016]|nr:MAG: hypothetical protein A4E46_00722 [Methanosaeta sp. PtaU1.Bin016]